MKVDRYILIAFILNLGFSIFEFIGGIFTYSVAIISDAVHDMGDAMSIGIAYFLEKKSKKGPDNKYTYGYARYSVLGATITTVILLVGSILVILGSIDRIINPADINYDGMIIFAIFGIVVNFAAVYLTKDGNSLNEKAVNLHILQDVFGWVVVLVGAIIMKFTNMSIIDPILSISISIFILFHAFEHLKEILDLFLEKTPSDIDISKIKEHILKIEDVKDVHHIHVWSIDGINNYATMHVKVDKDYIKIKQKIKEELKQHVIRHVTIELENEEEPCENEECHIDNEETFHNHNHHHQ